MLTMGDFNTLALIRFIPLTAVGVSIVTLGEQEHRGKSNVISSSGMFMNYSTLTLMSYPCFLSSA